MAMSLLTYRPQAPRTPERFPSFPEHLCEFSGVSGGWIFTQRRTNSGKEEEKPLALTEMQNLKAGSHFRMPALGRRNADRLTG